MCELEADGDGEFISHSTPCARKPRRCDECNGVIAKGDRYARSVSKWEGSVSVAVECMGCVAWREAFGAAHQIVEGYTCHLVLGGLWASIAEFTREYLGYDPIADEEDEDDAGQWAIDPRLVSQPASEVT